MPVVFVPFSDTVQVTLMGILASQECQNTLYFQYGSGTPGTDAMELLAAHLVTWFTTSLRSHICSQYALSMVKVVDLTSEFAPGIEHTAGLPSAGTQAGSSIPNSAAVTAKFTTGLRGRSFRGRNFVGGLVYENMSTSLLMSSTWVNTIKAAYQQFIDTPLSGWSWVVASRFTNHTPRVTGVCTPVIAVSVSQTIQSQRRRLLGRGA